MHLQSKSKNIFTQKQKNIHSKIVFFIKKNIEEDFRRIIGNRIEKKIKVEYVFQEVDDIPDEYKESSIALLF